MGISLIWGVCLLGLLIAILIGAKALWDSRRAPYFFLREEASSRARRVGVIILVLLMANLGLLVWRRHGYPFPIEFVPISAPTTPVPPSWPPRPTPSASPSPVPATPAPTLTLSPTFTLTPPPTYTGQAPTPTARPPTLTPTVGLEASFRVITLARGVSEENLPLEPGNVFSKGIKRVYVFFSYRGMEKGRDWAHAWYLDGEEIWSQSRKWRRGGEGIAWVYMEFSAGFPPGEYEVRLYIDHKLQEKVKFTVQ